MAVMEDDFATISESNFPEDGFSSLEDAPETPAPLFALRAFKTALFGTPDLSEDKARIRLSKSSLAGGEALGRYDAADNKGKRTDSNSVRAKGTKALNAQTPSPAKGILLTPGVGASRRKNVSFLYAAPDESSPKGDRNAEIPSPSISGSPTRRGHRRDNRSRPSKLTQRMIAAHARDSDSVLSEETSSSFNAAESSRQNRRLSSAKMAQIEMDITMDLSQPHSRSGQYWKNEYDSYYVKSDREMKKIIRYGQAVKSFAVKKDSEASRLAESLQQERSKIEALERKLSRMAKKLETAQASDLKGEGDHARLVTELAQQTTLAMKYKQKADQYRASVLHESSLQALDDPHGASQIMPGLDDDSQSDSRQDELKIQSENLHQTANSAEARAARYEVENAALRKSLSRIRGEMKSYEIRRKAREDRIEKQVEFQKAGKASAEAKLIDLRTKYQTILRDVSDGPPRDRDNNKLQAAEFGTGSTAIRAATPRKHRRASKPVDIWTAKPASGAPDVTPKQTDHAINKLPPSSVSQDVHKVLKEIKMNLAPNELTPIASEGNSPSLLHFSESKENIAPRRQSTAHQRSKSGQEPLGYEDGLPIYPPTSSPALYGSRGLRSKGFLADGPQEPIVLSSPAKLQAWEEDYNHLRRSSHPRSYNASNKFSNLRASIGPAAATAAASQSLSQSAIAHRFRPTNMPDKLTASGQKRSTPRMTAEREAAAKARLARRSAEKRGIKQLHA